MGVSNRLLLNLPDEVSAPGLALGAFSFALAVAILPGAFNASTAGRWALLSVCVPTACLAFLPQIERLKLTCGHLFGGLLLAWAALSLSWTPQFYDGLRETWFLMLFAGAFVLAAELPSLRPVYLGLGLGMAVNSAFVVAQWLGFDGVLTFGPPAGLFVNKNYLAEAAALVLIALVAHRMWWLVLAVLPCLQLTGGRAAFAGLAVAAMVWLWPRSKTAALTLLAALLLGCVALIGTSSINERFIIWQDTANGLTWLGRGIGAFFHDYPSHAGLKDLLISRPAHAHNDLLEMAYELGLPGVLLFALFLCSSYSRARRTELAILLAVLTEACFAFPLHLPVTGFVAAIAAGHLCGARAGVRDDFARWRVAFYTRSMALRERGRSAGAPADGAGGVPA